MNKSFVAIKIAFAMFMFFAASLPLAAQEVVVEGGKPSLTFTPEDEVFLISSSGQADVSVSGPKGDYTVRVTGPGTDEEVSLSIAENGGSDNGTAELKIPATPGEVTYTAKVVDKDVEVPKKVTAVKVEMANPKGNPQNSATAKLDENEFVFNDSTPGLLRISCQATLTPATEATRAWAEDNVNWEVSAIGEAGKSWEGEGNDSRGANVTCVFTGLPANNNAFGIKTVTMTAGDTPTTREIEVFYLKEAFNHPGPNQNNLYIIDARSPNWFYYWKQVIGNPAEIFYNTRNFSIGKVPAMYNWRDFLKDPPDQKIYSKTEVWIGPRASGKMGEGEIGYDGTTGIDLFANTVKHELFHVSQIAEADGLLGNVNGNPNTIWQYGWSWQVRPNYNHHLPNGVNLDADDNDVPDLWGANYSIEGKAQEQQTITENTYWESDFGYPGKRAGENQVYNR